MELKHPIITIIILGIVSIIYLAGLFFIKRKRPVFISNNPVLKKIVKNHFPLAKYIFNFLTYSIFGLIILSLAVLSARPISIDSYTNEKNGIDIMVVMDTSGSMDATDIFPSRLEASKKVIKDFVAKIKNDRIGMVLFTVSATTLSPLTSDYSIILNYIDEITFSNLIWMFDFDNTRNQASVIGDGIVLASNKFPKDSDRSKVIILLTDGEARGGVDPVKSAEYAKEKNIKIYSIFVGTDFASKAKATLGKMAEITNGKFYEATNSQTLSTVINDIDKLEKKEIEANSYTVERDNPSLLTNVASVLMIFFFITYGTKKIIWN